ncbi:hypothetical protein [Fimbriimonas ginsengisoli]|uniref:Uncharacterized protein n=1 Tax=Fimbriimonas ginsengisoli Gsoil 348 TaxID=661478 RepID=A0A068NPV9_FIMGI|nr:hypothetical protein [Fimbriimonas ginsengisoli]AIE83619.1 hypothetical protein OP10G_0251 [Fimbriimonas ginsengisoli Gsoil 348]
MIRHEVTIASPLAVPAARSSLIAWSQAIGYRLVSPAFLSSIQMERGSLMGNMGSLGPKTWSVKFHATFQPAETGCMVTLEWVISTFGQIGTRNDIEFWRKEVAWAMEASQGHVLDVPAHTKAASQAYNGNVWRALALTGAILLPLFGVAVVTESILLSFLAAIVGGTAAGFAFRAPRSLSTLNPPENESS